MVWLINQPGTTDQVGPGLGQIPMLQAPNEVFFFVRHNPGRECAASFQAVEHVKLPGVVNFPKTHKMILQTIKPINQTANMAANVLSSFIVKSSCKLETLLAFQTLPRGERAPRIGGAGGQEVVVRPAAQRGPGTS